MIEALPRDQAGQIDVGLLLSMATPEEQAQLVQLAEAPSFPPFVDWLEEVTPTWCWRWRWQEYVQTELNLITCGLNNRLMIFVPVRHGKTELVTVRYAAYQIEKDPSLNVILGAYNQDLADLFSRKIRRIIIPRGKVRVRGRGGTVKEWETTDDGGLRAVGVGSGVTGRGGNLILVDDPVKSRKEADSAAYRRQVWDWWNDDLWTRREPGAAVILIMSRWHRQDLAGKILSGPDAHRWRVVIFPALAGENDPLGRDPGEALCPDRYDTAALLEIKDTVTDRTFSSLYQQTPRAAGGNIFDEAWWYRQNRYDHAAVPLNVWGRYISLDTAEEETETAAYSVGVVGELHTDYTLDVRDVWREKRSFPDLPEQVLKLAKRWNYDGKLKGVIIEYASSGRQVFQTLNATAPPWLRDILVAWTPGASKVIRAEQASVWCKNGMIRLPEVGPAWLPDFEDELFDFPASEYNDQVDAFSQLIIYLEHFIEQGWRARK